MIELAEGDDDAEVGADGQGVVDPVGDRQAEGRGGRLHRARCDGALPRPRRLSGRVTTRATSNPSPTSASRGGTAMAGVPRKTSRRGRAGTGASVTGGASAAAGGAWGAPALGAGLGLEAAPLLQGFLALLVGHAVEHEHAVEVVELVLEEPGQQLVGLDRDLVAVEVPAAGAGPPSAGRSRRRGRGSTGSPRRTPTRPTTP